MNSSIVTDLDLQNEPPATARPPRPPLSETDVRGIVESMLAPLHLVGKRVLLIVPDSTRTAPMGLLFRAIYDCIGEDAAALDIMVALGTHPPMSEAAINMRLEITADERAQRYGKVRYLNHEWSNPEALCTLGTIMADEIGELSGGLFRMDVPVTVNRRLYDYDQLISVGPVFPHEVVGFSGGNKYLFPGVSGPEILNFFHWLGAVITNPRIIGHKYTAVRRVIDHAAAMVTLPKLAFCLVVAERELVGVFAGAPEAAWSDAAELSAEVHIVKKPRSFQTVLSQAPAMYDDLWVGGKCMYKLEPVVADGGELIIYAPHIREVSRVHGHLIRRLGYHTRDYFLKQWDRFQARALGRAGALHACARRRRVRRGNRPRNAAHPGDPGHGHSGSVSAARSTWGTATRLRSIPPITRGARRKASCSFASAGEMLYQLRAAVEWA